MSDLPATTAPVDQPTAAPTRKWIAGVSTGGGALVLVWLAGLLGVDMPPEVAGSLVLGAGAAAAWLKRNRAQLTDVLDRRDGGGHHDLNGDGIADGAQRP